MSATHLERIERLRQIEQLLPSARTPLARCPDVGRLQQLLGDEPGQRGSLPARRRMLSMRLWARVPSSGALLRWLLAGGDNLEVVAPASLRQVLAGQAAKMAAVYGAASRGSGSVIDTGAAVS